MRMWLQIVVTLNNNILLNNNIGLSLTTDHRMLLRLVQYVAIHLELTMKKLIDKNKPEIIKFIKCQWTQAQDAEFDKYYFLPSQPHVLVVECGKNQISTDIITGDFQVNNQPIAKLPSNITQKRVYERVFGHFMFEVQPGEPNSYSTTQEYHQCNYDFRLNPIGNHFTVLFK